MQTTTLAITGMSCGHCVAAVREALLEVPGVQVDDVRIGGARVRADGEHTVAAAIAAVREAGYEAAVGDAPAPALTPIATRRPG